MTAVDKVTKRVKIHHISIFVILAVSLCVVEFFLKFLLLGNFILASPLLNLDFPFQSSNNQARDKITESLLTPKNPGFFFVHFSSAHMVPVFILKTFVIRLLTMIPH